jgi:hypothetical protein
MISFGNLKEKGNFRNTAILLVLPAKLSKYNMWLQQRKAEHANDSVLPWENLSIIKPYGTILNFLFA